MPLYSGQFDVVFEAPDDREALLVAFTYGLDAPQRPCHRVVVNRADGSHPDGSAVDIITDLLSGSEAHDRSGHNGSIADLVRNNGTTKGLRRRNRK
jgi:hypothetical protein